VIPGIAGTKKENLMGMGKEFRDFAMKGNVVDMAVGVIIGGAFGSIVTTLVNNVMMPPIGLATGGIDFKDKKMVLQAADAAANKPEVAIGWGMFLNATINFIIVAFCLFMVIKIMNTAKKKFEKEQAAVPAAPPAPSAQEMYLKEIRDLLAKR